MKTLDLEKVIIIVSLVLMPVAGGWIYWQNQQLEESDRAFSRCDKTIEKIHGLHELITLTKKELDNNGSVDNASLYFENRGMASQKDGAGILKREQIRVNSKNSGSVRRGGGRGEIIGQDITAKVEFRGEKSGGLPLPRSFINAFIFNSEAASPLWKLRRLSMKNVDAKGSGIAPPLVMGDDWTVKTLEFARRKPVAPPETNRSK